MIESYDIAANRFYSSLRIKALPILSWDLYATFFRKVCDMQNDVLILRNLAKSNNWLYDENFDAEFLQKEHVIVVTDPQLKIVYVTQNMMQMNGYGPKEVLGEKPNMFQGIDTCKKTSNAVRMAVKNKESFEVVLLNYRKDNTTYKCWIKGEPIFNTKGEVVNFIAYEKKVA